MGIKEGEEIGGEVFSLHFTGFWNDYRYLLDTICLGKIGPQQEASVGSKSSET